MNKEELLEIIELAETPKAYEYADKIMQAYEKLDEMDSPEFTMLKLDYLMGRLNPTLKNIFEDYLSFNRKVVQELKKLQEILKVSQNNKEQIAKILDHISDDNVYDKLEELLNTIKDNLTPKPATGAPSSPFALARQVTTPLKDIAEEMEMDDNEIEELVNCFEIALNKFTSDDIQKEEFIKTIENVALLKNLPQHSINNMINFLRELFN